MTSKLWRNACLHQLTYRPSFIYKSLPQGEGVRVGVTCSKLSQTSVCDFTEEFNSDQTDFFVFVFIAQGFAGIGQGI